MVGLHARGPMVQFLCVGWALDLLPWKGVLCPIRSGRGHLVCCDLEMCLWGGGRMGMQGSAPDMLSPGAMGPTAMGLAAGTLLAMGMGHGA